MTKSKEETILVADNDQVIELTGANKQAFIADREATAQANAILETKYEAKKQARIDAITKLGTASGLTTEEIEATIADRELIFNA